MSLDLNSLLDLPASLDKRKLTVITSDDLNNSSFIFHSLIQSKVKSLRSGQQQSTGSPAAKAGLVLVCLNQSYTHYASVAAKSFGLNLNSLRQDGRLQVIDIVKDVQDYSGSNGGLDVEKLECSLSSLISSTDATAGTTACLVMIDDVRVLTSLGVPAPRVYLFIERIRSISCRCNCRLIIQSNIDFADEQSSSRQQQEDEEADDEEEDLEMSKLLACLISSSDVWIDVRKLKTGFSDKIDGSLILYDYCDNAYPVPVRYHYKTLERSTRIYTPGGLL